MKVERGRPARLLAGVMAGAMALSVSPLLGTNVAGAADPLPPLADPIAEGAVCDDAPGTNPFSDLGDESAGTREVILCLVATNLTAGTSATTYTPGGTVSRRQMAVFIKSLADKLNELESGTTDLEELPAYDGDPDYTDVEAEEQGFEEAIGQLSQAGIVGGFPDGTFRPNARVSRRQMAAFVNQLQEFLTGAPYAAEGDADYFDDDDGDSGEANLNALAAVGIFGGNGEGQVSPGDDLSRRQMANILMRDVQVFFADGTITSPFAGETSATFTVAPMALQTLEFAADVDATTPGDDRAYTAPDLPEGGARYQVTLVRTDKLFQESDGTYRFAEEGNTGLVDAGVLGARIVKVNGLVVAEHQHIGGIQPNDGTITFTVDGNGIEALVPVISVDGGSDSRLEINDDGVPIEEFGVGGELNYRPAEAADGSPANGTVSLLGPGYAVLDGAVSDSTVFFHADDVYLIGAGSSFEETTASAFRQELSLGDELRTCEAGTSFPAPYTQGAGTTYCLTDDSPGGPTNLTAAEGTSPTTQILLEWTAASPADSYNIYAYDRACSETSVSELAERASVSALDTSYEVTSLDPGATYCFVVTTVESGDESEVEVGTGAEDGDNTVEGTTTAS